MMKLPMRDTSSNDTSSTNYILIVYYIFAKNIDCGYTLDEYPQSLFLL